MSSRTPLVSAPWCVVRHGCCLTAARGRAGNVEQTAQAPAPTSDPTGAQHNGPSPAEDWPPRPIDLPRFLSRRRESER
jgi:hypothetical protein